MHANLTSVKSNQKISISIRSTQSINRNSAVQWPSKFAVGLHLISVYVQCTLISIINERKSMEKISRRVLALTLALHTTEAHLHTSMLSFPIASITQMQMFAIQCAADIFREIILRFRTHCAVPKVINTNCMKMNCVFHIFKMKH